MRRLTIAALISRRTLAFGLPPQVTAGLRLHVSPQFWEKTPDGGVFKAIRNLAYASSSQVVRNQITPDAGGYTVDFVVQAGDDCAIVFAVDESSDLSFELSSFFVSYVAAEARWHEWFSRVPSVDERYRLTYAYAWWIMANNFISP